MNNLGYKIDRIEKTVTIFTECDCGKRNHIKLDCAKFYDLLNEIKTLID